MGTESELYRAPRDREGTKRESCVLGWRVTWGLGGVWGTDDTLEDFRVSLELEVVPKGNGGEFLKGRERRALLCTSRGTI